MALILCPECKKEISSQATACPHCGLPSPAAVKPSTCNAHTALMQYEAWLSEVTGYKNEAIEAKARYVAKERTASRYGGRNDYLDLDNLINALHSFCMELNRRRTVLKRQIANGTPPSDFFCADQLRASEETLQSLRLSFKTRKAGGFTPGYTHKNPADSSY